MSPGQCWGGQCGEASITFLFLTPSPLGGPRSLHPAHLNDFLFSSGSLVSKMSSPLGWKSFFLFLDMSVLCSLSRLGKAAALFNSTPLGQIHGLHGLKAGQGGTSTPHPQDPEWPSLEIKCRNELALLLRFYCGSHFIFFQNCTTTSRRGVLWGGEVAGGASIKCQMSELIERFSPNLCIKKRHIFQTNQ